MDLDPIVPREAESSIPRAGPTRVVRAVPSEETLRESGRGLLIVGVAVLLLSSPLIVAAAGLWWEAGPRTSVRVALLSAPIAGYGLVCLVRGLRMRRQAARLARGRAGEVG